MLGVTSSFQTRVPRSIVGRANTLGTRWGASSRMEHSSYSFQLRWMKRISLSNRYAAKLMTLVAIKVEIFLMGDFYSVENVARSIFAIAYFWNVFSQAHLIRLIDCLYFKGKRLQKVDSATFCTEWRSALTNIEFINRILINCKLPRKRTLKFRDGF